MAAEKEGGQKEIQMEQERHNRAISELQVQHRRTHLLCITLVTNHICYKSQLLYVIASL